MNQWSRANQRGALNIGHISKAWNGDSNKGQYWQLLAKHAWQNMGLANSGLISDFSPLRNCELTKYTDDQKMTLPITGGAISETNEVCRCIGQCLVAKYRNEEAILSNRFSNRTIARRPSSLRQSGRLRKLFDPTIKEQMYHLQGIRPTLPLLSLVRVLDLEMMSSKSRTRSKQHVAHGNQSTKVMMNLTVRALFWILIISAATSLVFEAWRGRAPNQSSAFHDSDDPGDPPSLGTYRGSHPDVDYRVLSPVRTSWSGDEKSGVSAVILNWSRFKNVVLIVSGLCDPSLRDVISEIIVWNNSPRKISAKEFDMSCSSKLRIANSPENSYFQARFMACSDAAFKYCFIQDDDYLVKPEVIKTLYSRIRLSEIPRSIHLLPPHEHLSSTSLTGYSFDGRIHTRFAWLGHGTMLHRELSESFLSVMDNLKFSSEERKMADNYFTVLRNDFAELWHDQGIELGGGQPFTVGTEGEQRNRLHIGKALTYLDEFLDSPRSHPYILKDVRVGPPRGTVYAACSKQPCLLSASLTGSLSGSARQVRVAKDLLPMASNSSGAVGQPERPLSRAVDANPRTYFESKQEAQVGDSFTLDLTGQVGSLLEGIETELAFLVDAATADLLNGVHVDHSPDERQWSPPVTRPSCHQLTEIYGGELTECCFRFRGDVSFARYLRITLRSLEETASWRIHEIWARTLSVKTVENVP